MGPQKFHWFCPKRFELLLSTDLLGGSKYKETFFKKKLFSGLCSQSDTTSSKKHTWAHILEEKKGKCVFFLFRATAYQQVFSNLSCKCSVKFSGRKISRVFLHSERNFFKGVPKLTFEQPQIHIWGWLFWKISFDGSLEISRQNFLAGVYMSEMNSTCKQYSSEKMLWKINGMTDLKLALRNRFSRVFTRRDQENDSQNFMFL